MKMYYCEPRQRNRASGGTDGLSDVCCYYSKIIMFATVHEKGAALKENVRRRPGDWGK